MSKNTKNIIKEVVYNTGLITLSAGTGYLIGLFFKNVIRPAMFKRE